MKSYFIMLSIQVVLAVVIITQTGCVPAILGIKEYKSGDTTISFITGFDVGASASGTDTLDNNIGIKPNGQPARGVKY